MKKYDTYQEFCTGCGLCRSVKGIPLYEDDKGFVYPDSKISEEKEFCSKVCLAGGNSIKTLRSHNVWGRYHNVYSGHSLDCEIRKRASSGGVITSLCIYLLENKIVDGIIQIKMDDDVPYKTDVVISRSKDDVLKCMGSRYGISSPLKDIKSMANHHEKYAFVGKPCDVSALKMYQKEYQDLSEQIIFTISFFCAGMPSDNAQRELLERLGCRNVDECDSLHYRGNGWPGYATCVKNGGEINKITYDESWGQILGRDVRKSCRFCIDGIGELADVACGDAWYLDESRKPDFSERAGRNVIFVRTEKGKKVLNSAFNKRYIELMPFEIDELQYMQAYQYERRTTMIAKILALRVMRRGIPHYSLKVLYRLAVKGRIRSQLRIFKGTIQRISKGVI